MKHMGIVLSECIIKDSSQIQEETLSAYRLGPTIYRIATGISKLVQKIVEVDLPT